MNKEPAMDDEIIDRIRRMRREQRAAAKASQGDRFNPFQIGDIVKVRWVAEDGLGRATLYLDLEDGSRHCLPHFYPGHARHLEQLEPADRAIYLREVWLNYSRGLIAVASSKR